MRFEFLACCRAPDGSDLRKAIRDCLSKVMLDNLNEVDDTSLEQIIRFRHERHGDQPLDESEAPARQVLLGFVLDLSEQVNSLDIVIDDFTAALPETDGVDHVIKFEDPLMQQELAERAREISALEMKLRRVLTFIYLHANQRANGYELLTDESVQPMAKERPNANQMKEAAENQFFHLTFGQYINLNQRPEPKLAAVLELLRAATQYDDLRSELLREPIAHEDDAVLLAGLKERMDAIERMRNCVAHNRRPTHSVRENYRNVRPLLEKLLDGYLDRWQVHE